MMNIKKWLSENTESLLGKTVAVTGTTGGLGKELCRYLAYLGANLILLDRNTIKSNSFKNELLTAHPTISVECINVNLEDIESVVKATEIIKTKNLNLFIHNAGAYSIPRHKCATGLDNVFQINFASPYYMIRELLPYLSERVVVVGSIAHRYSKTDENDIDFSSREAASKVYGNAKRYLMFALYELFKNEKRVALAVTHPGISFTNITAHYPKIIFAVIKYPMKVIFMQPKKACLSILKGVFCETKYHEWLGPKYFDVWGKPYKKALNSCSIDECEHIAKTAEKVYLETCRQKDTI